MFYRCRPWVGLLALVLLLSACSGFRSPEPENPPPDELLEPIVVRVSGFGTYADADERSNPRERLKARRASKLDAYRALAERVYGTVIYGSATVNDFVLQHDSFRTFVDSYIRGARVVAVTEHDDGVVETVMQLKLEPRFRACVAAVDPAVTKELCPIPMPQERQDTGDVQATSSVDSLYYLE
ncbi:LPP20 family lipoprotein [Marinobacteraceae bacterium S3BR75-40.1]